MIAVKNLAIAVTIIQIAQNVITTLVTVIHQNKMIVGRVRVRHQNRQSQNAQTIVFVSSLKVQFGFGKKKKQVFY